MSYGFGKTGSPDMSNAMREQCCCSVKDCVDMRMNLNKRVMANDREEKQLVLTHFEMTCPFSATTVPLDSQ